MCSVQTRAFAPLARRTQQRRARARLLVIRTRAARSFANSTSANLRHYFNRVAISFAIAFVAAFVGASEASAFRSPKSWIVPS